MKRAATNDTVAPYLNKVICLKWSEKEAYPLSADQIQNLKLENNLWNFDGKKFLKASNGYWLVTEVLGDIKPHTIVNTTTGDRISIFIGKEDTWTTTWHAELFYQSDELADILIDWKLYPEDIKKTLRGEISDIYQNNDKISIKNFLEQFDQVIRVLVLKNTDNLSSAIYFMMARSQLLDKFDYNSRKISDENKLLYAKFLPDCVKLQVLFSEQLKNEELYLEAITEVEGRQTQIEKTKKILEHQKSLQANEKWSVAREQRQAIVAESETELTKLKVQSDPLVQTYKQGIYRAKYVAEHYFHFPYSATKTRANFYLHYTRFIFDEAKTPDRGKYSAEQIVLHHEIYKGARKHLKNLFNLQLAGEKIMDHLPTDMFLLTTPHTAAYISYNRDKYKDYQIRVAAEELARSEYTTWTDAEKVLGSDYESNISLLSAIIFFRILKSYNTRPAEFSVIDILHSYLEEKLKRDPLFPGELPVGYYTLNDFKGRKAYDTQYHFNEQFNTYDDNFLNYDVRVLSGYLLASTAIPRLQTVIKVDKQYLFHIEKFIGEEQQHYGTVLSMEINDGWFVVSDLDGTIKAEFFSGKEGEFSLLPEVFTNPHAKLGSIKETFFPLEPETPIPITHNTQPIYYPADNTPLGESVELRIFWNRMGYDTFDKTPQLMLVNNDSDYNAEDRCVVYNVQKFVENSIRTTLGNAKSQLDETGVWHKIAIYLIPFYEVIYKAATDRKYSPSAEDIVSIIIDTVATFAIIVDAGVKISQLTNKTVSNISLKAFNMKLAGFSRGEILAQTALFIVKESGTTLLPSVMKTLTTSLLELVNPIPFLNISDVARYIYKHSSRMFNRMASPAKSGFFDPLLMDLKLNPDPSDAVYIDPAELHASPILEHTNIPGKIYKKHYFESSEPRYIINNDNKYYRVKWDAEADSWRMMIATDIDNYRRGPLVKFVENQWLISPETIVSGESCISRKLTPGLRKVLQQGNSFLLPQSYDQKMKEFYPSDDFTVLRMSTTADYSHGLSAFSAQLASDEILEIAKKLLDYTGDYIGTDKNSLVDALNSQLNHADVAVKSTPQRLTRLATYNEPVVDYYALVKKDVQDNFLAEQVYGLLCLNTKPEAGSIQVEYLLSHPYIIANNFSEFREYLLKNDLVPVATLNKYNLRLSASHLLSTGLSNSIYNIETDYETALNYIRIPQQDSATEPLIVALQNSSDYNLTLGRIASQTTFSAQEKLPLRLSDIASGKPYLAGLKPSPAPVYLEEYELTAELNHFLAHNSYKLSAINLVAAQQSAIVEYQNFAKDIKRCADKVYQKYSNILDILKLSREDEKILASIKGFLSDVTGLNKENFVYDTKYQNTIPENVVLEQLFARFVDKIQLCHDCMLQHKKMDYTSFGIIEETGLPGVLSGKAELKNKISGFIIPGDREMKIYLSLPAEESYDIDLTLDILHQSIHAATATSDLSYSGHQRFGINRLTSIYDELYINDKTFFDCHKNEKLVAGYILNIKDTSKITDKEIKEATKYFINNKLVRADTLFNTTEFNTRMIYQFNEIYKLDETRKKIVQAPLSLSSCIFRAAKQESKGQSRNVRGLDIECGSTSRLGTIKINNDSYHFFNHDEELFRQCYRKYKSIIGMETNTSQEELILQTFFQGMYDHSNAKYNRYDKLTPNQRMDNFLNVDENYSNDQLGALFYKIIIDGNHISNYFDASNAKIWQRRASKMGAYKIKLFPQDIIISGQGKLNLIGTVIVSWAIENNLEPLLVNRLNSLPRDTILKNNDLFNDIAQLNTDWRIWEFFYDSYDIQFIYIDELIKSESKLFNNNTTSVRAYIKKNIFSISLSENHGIKAYCFYDPNYGVSYFTKYDKMCEFITLQIQRVPDYATNTLTIKPLNLSDFEKSTRYHKSIRAVVTGENPEMSFPDPEHNYVESISTDLDDWGPFSRLGLSIPDIRFDINDVRFQNHSYIRSGYARFTEATDAILHETCINMKALNTEKNQHKKEKAAQSMKYTDAKLNRYAAHAGVLISDGKNEIDYKDGFLNIVLTPVQRAKFPGQGNLEIYEAKFQQRYLSKNKLVNINLDQPSVKAKYYKVSNLDKFIDGIKDHYLKKDESLPLHSLIEKRIREHIEEHIEGNIYLLPITSGIPGFHAEVQALNYVLTQAQRLGSKIDNVLNQSYIFTQRLAGRMKGYDFAACHNCTGILSGLEHVMTGKVGKQKMFTFRRTY